MCPGRKLVIAVLFSFALVSGRSAFAATPDELAKDRVLHQLDVASANFHSTSAEFEFDSVQTDPVPD